MSDPAPLLRRPPRPLTDGVVTLDEFGRDDVLDIVFAIDDEILRWLPLPDPYAETDARTFVDSPPASGAVGESLAFAIRWQGGLAGAAGVSTNRSAPDRPRIGYWVAPHARNRGVARRAVQLLADHTFATCRPHRIELLVHPDNHASRRAAEAAGAVFERIRPGALDPPPRDGTADAAVYVLTAGG